MVFFRLQTLVRTLALMVGALASSYAANVSFKTSAKLTGQADGAFFVIPDTIQEFNDIAVPSVVTRMFGDLYNSILPASLTFTAGDTLVLSVTQGVTTKTMIGTFSGKYTGSVDPVTGDPIFGAWAPPPLLTFNTTSVSIEGITYSLKNGDLIGNTLTLNDLSWDKIYDLNGVVTPEPGYYALLALGLGGAVIASRRRRANHN